jgi:hypothetical protein
MAQKDTPILWIIAIIAILIGFTAVYMKLRRWQEGFEEEGAEGFAGAVAASPDPTLLATPEPNKQPLQKNATFCPPGSKYYVNKRGDSLCCEGEVENRRCRGTNVCTLSAPHGNIPSCSVIQTQLLSKMSTAYCPPSMPNFYASELTGLKGCTSSAITTAGDGPLHPNAPKCTIGSSPSTDLTDPESCLNKKRLEEMACLSPDCTKSLHKMRGISGMPLVITQMFNVPSTGAPRSCTDEHSMEIFLDAAEPGWRSKGNPNHNFAMSVEFCGTAKATLIDKQYVQGVSA